MTKPGWRVEDLRKNKDMRLMTRPELEREITTWRAAVRQIRDLRGDDKCWKDWDELYKFLPEGYTPPARDETVELELCKQYIASCHRPGTAYVSPQRRIEELESQVKLLGQALGEVLDRVGVLGGGMLTGPELLCAAETYCKNG